MKSPLVVVLVIIVILVAAFVVYRTVKGPAKAQDYSHEAVPGGKGPQASGQMQQMPTEPKGL